MKQDNWKEIEDVKKNQETEFTRRKKLYKSILYLCLLNLIILQNNIHIVEEEEDKKW